MRGSLWHRVISAVLALWLGVFIAEPEALHACPIHSPAPAGHASHAGMHHDMHGTPGHQGAGHACSCPGPCCAAALTPLPAVVVHTLDVALVVVARPGRPQHEFVAAWVDFVLPYATAPPVTLV